jgi:hypothetical protein
MSKFISLVLALFFVAATLGSTAATYTTSKNKVVSVNPVSLSYGKVNVSLESKMGTSNSFTGTFGYWNWQYDYTAINIGVSYKWYIDAFEEGKNALNGLAIGPRLDYYFWNYSGNNPYYKEYSGFDIGAEVSYKWVFGNGKWAVEPLISFGFPILKNDYNYKPQNYGWGVNLGYCF